MSAPGARRAQAGRLPRSWVRARAVLAGLVLLLAGCASDAPMAAPSWVAPLPASPEETALDPAPIDAAGMLPFDLPSTADLRSSDKLVFAHYWPPLPISIDNQSPSSDYYSRNYLTPGGESGKHAAYGGHLRDRPLPRDTIAEADWRADDMRTEVRQAIAAGLDGFALDVLQLEGDRDHRVWDNARHLVQAAESVDPGFKIMLMPDMSGSLVGKSQAELARGLAPLAASPSAFRLADGRLVISPFKAEAHPPQWWQEFMTVMSDSYGLEVAFVPVFVADERKLGPKYSAISLGMSNWGARNPKWNDPTDTGSSGLVGRIAKVHERGDLWMQPVSMQDSRPNQGIFDEAENTTNLRNTWTIARRGKADWVQIPTWNDYTENADIAPSVKQGWTFLDLNSYFLTWFKTGSRPEIVRDTVYLTHRSQPWQATQTYPQTSTMSLRGGSPARDTVEALTFLTEPGEVTVTVGGRTSTCRAPAGLGVCTVPLAVGSVSAEVTRGGQRVATVASPYSVSDTPTVQDLQYVGASSLRQAAEAARPGPVTGSPATKGAVRTVGPVADTYANEGVPDATFGSTSTLASTGSGTGAGAVSYLRFGLPASPGGRRLVSARLRIRTTAEAHAGSADPHVVRLASNAWAEPTLSWANRPGTGTATVGTVPAATVPGTTYDIVLSTLELAELSGSTVALSVSGDGADSLWFWSGNHPDPAYRPRLELGYS